MLSYPLNFVIWCHNWLGFGSPIFENIFSFFLSLSVNTGNAEFTVHSNICYPRTVYSHFLQILSLPFMWLIWDIYVSLTFGWVGKLNFRMQEIALLVQKVTKYNQLSITSRGLSGLWISCATLKGNLLYDTFTKSSMELSLLRYHAVSCFWPSSKCSTEYFPPT